jgi:hypothetical protein
MRVERDEARAEASAGKVTRDKARQRSAGDAIRAVVNELAAYGLREVVTLVLARSSDTY